MVRLIRSTVVVCILIVSALVMSLPVSAAPADPEVVINEPHAEDVVLVEFVSGTPAAERASIAMAAGAAKRESLSPLAVDVEKLFLNPGMTVERALTNLQRNPNVRYAEPNYLLETVDTPNDTYYVDGYLWGMYGDTTNPSNQYGSGAGEAWDMGKTGSSNVYVGVIDEGIQFTHPDLTANVWTNTFDPVDGIDNDGNGKIDDIHGWDFYYDNNSIYDGTADDHGTHVAGTIGAKGGNGTGVAGVNWQVTLISTKFLGPDGGYTSDAIEALDYLTDLKQRHGLNIVATNNSWGGGGFSQLLLDAINRSADEEMLFVAAAGNKHADTDKRPFYPACYQAITSYDTEQDRGYDAVIAVAAINSSGDKSSFSNYGTSTVDIGAPGESIWSTIPTNSYDRYSGTSMATPHVTGAIALMASINPDLNAEEIRNMLITSVAPTPSLVGKTVTGGRLDIGAMVGLDTPNPGNQVPLAYNLSISTAEDTSVKITLTGDDGDPELTQNLTFTIGTGPSHGSLSDFNSSTGEVTYTPVANYNNNTNNPDSFTFTVNDGYATSDPATVTIEVTPVDDVPVANDQSVTTDENTSALITLTGDDGDPELTQNLTFAIGTGPSHGSLSDFNSSTGEVTYSPVAGFTNDSFTFTVNDGNSTSDPATVSIMLSSDPQMHVSNILVETFVKHAGKNDFYWAEATVTVVDSDGDPVDGVTVTGVWTGMTSDADTGITGSNGTVVLTSDSIKNTTGTFTFTVVNLVKDGWGFDESAIVLFASFP